MLGRKIKMIKKRWEDLGMELDDCDLVVWRHGEGVYQLINRKPGRGEYGGESDVSPQYLRRSSLLDTLGLGLV